MFKSTDKLQTKEDDDQQDTLNCTRSMLLREQTSYLISPSTQDEPFSVVVTPAHRKRAVEWCFTMVERLKLRPATIERAINFIDRLVLLKVGEEFLSDTMLYYLGFATSLYLMTKCHGYDGGRIRLKDIVDICNCRDGGEENGIFNDDNFVCTTEQLATIEIVILDELDWSINPPTTFEYFAQFLKLLGLPVSDEFDPKYEVVKVETDDDQVGDSVSNRLLESAFAEVQESLQDYDCAKRGAFHNAYNAFIMALSMINGGSEMADRLEAMLLSAPLAPFLERCRSSDSCTSDLTASTTSHDSFRSSGFSGEKGDALSSLAKTRSQVLSDHDNTSCTAKSDDESIFSEDLGNWWEIEFDAEGFDDVSLFSDCSSLQTETMPKLLDLLKPRQDESESETTKKEKEMKANVVEEDFKKAAKAKAKAMRKAKAEKRAKKKEKEIKAKTLEEECKKAAEAKAKARAEKKAKEKAEKKAKKRVEKTAKKKKEMKAEAWKEEHKKSAENEAKAWAIKKTKKKGDKMTKKKRKEMNAEALKEEAKAWAWADRKTKEKAEKKAKKKAENISKKKEKEMNAATSVEDYRKAAEQKKAKKSKRLPGPRRFFWWRADAELVTNCKSSECRMD